MVLGDFVWTSQDCIGGKGIQKHYLTYGHIIMPYWYPDIFVFHLDKKQIVSLCFVKYLLVINVILPTSSPFVVQIFNLIAVQVSELCAFQGRVRATAVFLQRMLKIYLFHWCQVSGQSRQAGYGKVTQLILKHFCFCQMVLFKQSGTTHLCNWNPFMMDVCLSF